MLNVRFESKLTLPQAERIRWRLFPELRIHQKTLGLGQPEPAEPAPEDELKVMDLAQEEIARNLGDGHRVIHGVAGSGKTLILAYRCQHLARTLGIHPGAGVQPLAGRVAAAPAAGAGHWRTAGGVET